MWSCDDRGPTQIFRQPIGLEDAIEAVRAILGSQTLHAKLYAGIIYESLTRLEARYPQDRFELCCTGAVPLRSTTDKALSDKFRRAKKSRG